MFICMRAPATATATCLAQLRRPERTSPATSTNSFFGLATVYTGMGASRALTSSFGMARSNSGLPKLTCRPLPLLLPAPAPLVLAPAPLPRPWPPRDRDWRMRPDNRRMRSGKGSKAGKWPADLENPLSRHHFATPGTHRERRSERRASEQLLVATQVGRNELHARRCPSSLSPQLGAKATPVAAQAACHAAHCGCEVLQWVSTAIPVLLSHPSGCGRK
jgi:hypothetical protein